MTSMIAVKNLRHLARCIALIAIVYFSVAPLFRESSAFGNDVVIPHPAAPDSEPSIAISPINANVVLVGSIDISYVPLTLPRVRYYFSQDGGVTWPLSGLIPLRTTSKPYTVDPSVGFDRSGNAWYSALEFSKSPVDFGSCDSEVIISKNPSSLTGWTAPVKISPIPDGGGTCFDQPSLAIDKSGGPLDGTVYVIMVQFTQGMPSTTDLILRYRNHSNGTWSLPFQLTNDGRSRGAGLAIGSDGSLYVSWFTVSVGGSTTGTLFVGKFDTSSGTLTGPAPVATLYALPQNGPLPQTIAADQMIGGTVYVGFQNEPSGQNNTDIFFAKSIDSAATWSVPKKVNDDQTSTNQYLPRVTSTGVTSGIGLGRVDFVWYDERGALTNPDTYQVWYSSSPDRGETFEPNVQSSDSFYSKADHDFRDYFGMASTEIAARPAWTGVGPGGDQEIITDKQVFYNMETRTLLGGIELSPGPGVSLDNGRGFFLPTPLAFSVNPGSHTLRTAACSATGQNTVRLFDHWDDLSTASVRALNVQGNLTGAGGLKAYFRDTSGSCPQGDVNNDCIVNVQDLALVGSAYGSTPSSPNWNPYADLNHDGVVNNADLNIVNANFGHTCPS